MCFYYAREAARAIGLAARRVAALTFLSFAFQRKGAQPKYMRDRFSLLVAS